MAARRQKEEHSVDFPSQPPASVLSFPSTAEDASPVSTAHAPFLETGSVEALPPSAPSSDAIPGESQAPGPLGRHSDRKVPFEASSVHPNCAQILLVEDNPGDARLTREVFAEGRITNDLHVVSDGVEALRFLRAEGPYAGAPRPDLILLDLNLPRMDGREVLATIKADPALRTIPVVVLSTSAADRDIDQSYQLHANSFITKPVDLDQFITVVRSIESFWLTIVRLPHDSR
jgi:chemotaxis family two-component system response regulator Rcp1